MGALLALLGLVLPAALGPVRRGWMSLALLISKVTTPILLGVIYFAVITPVGLVRRLLGRDPMRVRHRKPSVWVEWDATGSEPSNMEHQF